MRKPYRLLALGLTALAVSCSQPTSGALPQATACPLPEFAPDFRFGLVAFHIPYAHYRLHPGDFPIIAKAGVNSLSIDFAWRDIEPEPGKYDFRYYDLIMENARANGLEVVPKVGNGYNEERATVPEWTKSLSRAEYNKALSEYTKAIVERYGDQVKAYALENEANFWATHINLDWREGDWDRERIFTIWETLSETLRAADPEAELILSLSGDKVEEWFPEITERIDYDTFGLQIYPSWLIGPPDATPAVTRIKEVAKLSGKPVTVLETGYHTAMFRQDSAQGEYVQSMLSAAIQGGAKGVFFYTYLENPYEEKGNERYFGMVKQDRTPKAGFKRYQEINLACRSES